MQKAKVGFSTALNDLRLTRIGKLLRKWKIDELPQLLNVISGDMSLVGPRPQVPYYTDKYNQEEAVILSVKPGITDYASIYYSNMDEVLGNENVDHFYEQYIEPKKNQLRIQYVKDQCLWVDLKILFATVIKLLGFKKTTTTSANSL